MNCPGCVNKIKNALEKEKKVAQVSLIFSTQKLKVNYEPEVTTKEGEHVVAKVIKSLGFDLVKDSGKIGSSDGSHVKSKKNILYWSGILFFFILAITMWKPFPSWAKMAFTFATVWGLYPVIRKVFHQMQQGVWFGIEALMSLACIGALLLGEYPESALVLILFRVGEYLESFAASRAHKGVQSLMNLAPDNALLLVDNTQKKVPVKELKPGDCILLRPGDRLPVDGILMGNATFDMSALTGESLPVCKSEGDKVMAGILTTENSVRLKVTSEPGNNAIDRICQMIENAESHKAPVERLIDRFSRRYTPIMMLIALMAVLAPPLLFHQPWAIWVYRGLALLLIACPCALVISTPAAVTSALAHAARKGVLIKGGAILERLASIKIMAFDKTGTLTSGQIRVEDMLTIRQNEEWFKLAASIEQSSTHPLAVAMVDEANRQGISLFPTDSVLSLSGKGVKGKVRGYEVSVISPGYLQQRYEGTLIPEYALKWTKGKQIEGKTVTVVCINGTVYGMVAFSDTLRKDAGYAVDQLEKAGVGSIMLTGDNQQVAACVAGKLKISYKAELLPEDKVRVVNDLNRNSHVAMVGDGINDAPAFKAAHVGIAMGKGSDTALELADVALTHERLASIAGMIRISRRTHHIIRQNIALALGLKCIVLMTTVFGMTGLLIAVLSDAGATVIVTANSLRLLNDNRFQKIRKNNNP